MSPLIINRILEVKNLKMYFPITRGLLRKTVGYIKAVNNVSFEIKRGEIFGLVGESGCGKTSVARCILRIYQPTDGKIFFENKDLIKLSRSELRSVRKKIQLIFQDPYSSLDPRQNAGDIVGEPLKIFKLYKEENNYRNRIKELFQMVGLDPEMVDRYPHEFSGGQRQRIGIARALACEPSFIVCDEPISALDVSIQAQIINLLLELKEKIGLTYLFISHDLSVVKYISDRIAIMYMGHIIEITDSEELYKNPIHPYTKALLSAIPIPDPFKERQRERIILKGDVPSPMNPPGGCSFHPRCWMSKKECYEIIPALHEVAPNHYVACHFSD